MNNTVELMNLFWTTAGIYPGRGDVSPYDFEARVQSAAKAGFRGVGLWHTDLAHILQSRTLSDLKHILDDNGMKYLELEFLTDWFLDGERKTESDRWKRLLFEASAALGAKHVKMGDFNRTLTPMPRLVEAFAALCKEAEDYGATIAFEFMASAMIDNLPDALTLVESAGAKNGGLVLDIVHVVNLGITYDDLRRIPLQYLVNVELNDGTLPGTPGHDSSGARRFCGAGTYDIKGFIDCVTQMGYTGPWAVEVFSPELLDWPLDRLNTTAYETTIAQFEA